MDALRVVLAADGSEPTRAAERLIDALCRRDGPDFTAPSVAALVVTSPPPPAWTRNPATGGGVGDGRGGVEPCAMS